MTTYGVTEAAGQLGRLAVQKLLARRVPASDVAALVRDPAKATDLADHGVRVRGPDYAQPQTLLAALPGVDRLVLVSSSEAGQRVAHHTNVIRAANRIVTGHTVRITKRRRLNHVRDRKSIQSGIEVSHRR